MGYTVIICLILITICQIAQIWLRLRDRVYPRTKPQPMPIEAPEGLWTDPGIEEEHSVQPANQDIQDEPVSKGGVTYLGQ